MIESRSPAFILTVFSLGLWLIVPAIAADENKSTQGQIDPQVKELIDESQTMQKTSQKPDQKFYDRTLDAAAGLKAKADAKAKESEDNIEAIERGEEPPHMHGAIPAQLLQPELDNAEELLRAGSFEDAEVLAQQVLAQSPDSVQAKSIIQRAETGLKTPAK